MYLSSTSFMTSVGRPSWRWSDTLVVPPPSSSRTWTWPVGQLLPSSRPAVLHLCSLASPKAELQAWSQAVRRRQGQRLQVGFMGSHSCWTSSRLVPAPLSHFVLTAELKSVLLHPLDYKFCSSHLLISSVTNFLSPWVGSCLPRSHTTRAAPSPGPGALAISLTSSRKCVLCFSLP